VKLVNEKDLLQDIYLQVRRRGRFSSPRGLKILEVENFSYELPPFVRFTNFEPRKFNLDYLKREFLWYLRGDLFDTSISNFASTWKHIIVDGKLNSNYGFYVFRRNKFGGLKWCIEELTRDPDSRRACITILDHTHLDAKEKDVPCTGYLNFRIRENKLNMSVRMRSQDCLFGLSNDLPCFSFMQEILYRFLASRFEGLEMGSYHHTADSFHVYERHFEMLDKLCDPAVEFTPIECPRIMDENEAVYLIDYYKQGVKPGKYQKFANWLTTVDKFISAPIDWTKENPEEIKCCS
jgi:thymidylate synthase